MDTNVPASRNNFDLVAPVYELTTLVFGGSVRRSQRVLLKELGPVKTILVIGGGTGWFLVELLEQTNAQRIIYLEKSKKMLDMSRRLVQRRLPARLERVEFRHGTEDSVTSNDGPIDLVVTNFFLSQFTTDNCLKIARRLHSRLTPSSRWLFVDFEKPAERGWQRWAALAMYKLMFTFFILVSDLESRRQPDWEYVFGQLHMRPAVHKQFFAGMIHGKILVPAPNSIAATVSATPVQPRA
jgi:tRNA (cmo5U34)-methyltransferase